MNLAEWAVLRMVPLVFLSGATVYKDPYAEKISEGADKVVNGFGGFYGYSKLLAENIFEHFVEKGLKIVILRPSSVYGDGLGNEKLITNYLQLASQNKQIEIDSPDNRINLIHALDVAKAAYLAFKKEAWGVYNVAADYAPTIYELAQLSIKICGGGRVHINDNTSTEKPFFRFDLDVNKAKKTFSFVPSISLEEGLKLMKEKRTL
jgi:nucleoside-diphosphate-sugar epimerase